MYPLFENEEQGIGIAQQALDDARGFLRRRPGPTSTTAANDKDFALRFQFESLEDTLKVVADSCYARRLAEPGETLQCNRRANLELLRSIATTARRMTNGTTTVSSSSGEEDTSITSQRVDVGSQTCGHSTSGSSSSTSCMGSFAVADDSSPGSPRSLRRTNALRLMKYDQKRDRSSLASVESISVESDLHDNNIAKNRTRLSKDKGKPRPLSENPIPAAENHLERGLDGPQQSELSKRAGKRRESPPESGQGDGLTDPSPVALSSGGRDRRAILKKSTCTPLSNKSSLHSLLDVPPPVPPKRPISHFINEHKDEYSTAPLGFLRRIEELHRLSAVEPIAGPSRVRSRVPVDINPQNDTDTATVTLQPARGVARANITRPVPRRLVTSTPPRIVPPPRLRVPPNIVRTHRSSIFNTEPKTSCTACGDRFPLSTKHLKTSCGHSFCGDCAANLVEAHNRQESLHPLRCCANTLIPHTQIEPFLSPDQIAQFHGKLREYNTPYRRRVYCPKKGCSQFIKLGKMGVYLRRTVKCPTCASSICVGCREFSHPGRKCNAEDVHAVRFQRLVKDKGWQRCPNCHRIVERTEGCLHMTCLCKFEFCYRCGAKSGSKCGHGLF